MKFTPRSLPVALPLLGMLFFPSGILGQEPPRISEPKRMLPMPASGVCWMALHPGGEKLALTTYEGQVGIWNLVTGQLEREVADLKGSFRIAMSPDGKLLAGSVSGVTICDVSTGKVKARLPLKISSARQIAFSPNGKSIAAIVGSNGHEPLILWNLASNNVVAIPGAPSGLLYTTERVPEFAFSKDTRYLYYTQALSTRQSQRISQTQGPAPDTRITSYFVKKRDLRSGSDRILYSTSFAGSYEPDARWRQMLLTPDEQTLLLATGKQVNTVKGGMKENSLLLCGGVAVSPDQSTFALNQTNTVTMIDPPTGTKLLVLQRNEVSRVSALNNPDPVVFTPDGKYLLSPWVNLNKDCFLLVWDVERFLKQRALAPQLK